MYVFFFNDTATTEIYTLSLHDALPISSSLTSIPPHATPNSLAINQITMAGTIASGTVKPSPARSEEHTSELQSRQYLVCRLLLEKKKKNQLLSPSCFITIPSRIFTTSH